MVNIHIWIKCIDKEEDILKCKYLLIEINTF